jgi:hypothetical protein
MPCCKCHSGLELDHQMLKRQFKTSLPIALMSIAFPFGIGAASSVWWYDVNGLPDVNWTGIIELHHPLIQAT